MPLKLVFSKKSIWVWALLSIGLILIFAALMTKTTKQEFDPIDLHYFPPEFDQSDSANFPTSRITRN